MNGSEDDDLRALFHEARRDAEKNGNEIPSFRRVLERPRKPGATGSRWAVRMLAAAGAAAVILVATVSVRTLSRPPEFAAQRIETWTPPTDFLLENSFTTLLDTTPALTEPVPDYSTLLEEQPSRKGNNS